MTRSRDELVAIDDIHEVGDEPWWREAWYFELYDPRADVALKTYAGVFPNQERADLLFHVARSDRVVHADFRTDYRIPRRPGHDRLSFGPQLLELLEPGKRWRVRYQSDAVACDLHFEATQELFSWAESDLSMEESAAPSRHIDQPGRYTGWIELEGERAEIDTIGMRDRMWGWGDRSRWANYLIMWAPFDDDFVVNIACHEFTDGHVELAGYIHRDGVRAVLDAAEVAIEWDEERWKTIRSVESTVTDANGRTVTMRSRPSFAVVDTGGRWPHRVDHMLVATGLHEAEEKHVHSCFNWSFLTYEGRPHGFSVRRGG